MIANPQLKKIKAFSQKNSSEIWFQATIVGLMGILLRLPFQSQILHEWDSVQFALALDNFDIRLHQPHPPGLFVVYIFFGRLFNLVFQDANASLVWLSTVATGLGVAAIFILATTWFGRQAGLTIALLTLFSPLVWFQGEVALSYMGEFFWVLLIVWGCFHLRYGNKLALYSSTILMGLAGGIRPNTLFFLFPLWLVALYLGTKEGKYKIKQFALVAVLFIVSIACWFIPLMVMSGGVQGYWQALQPWLNEHPQDGAGRGLHGIYLNIKILCEALLYGVGFAIVPALWLAKRHGSKLKRKLWHDWRFQTLALWIAPGLLYLTFVHMQRLGHCFTILPAWIMLAGLATFLAGRYCRNYYPHAPAILILLVLLGNGLFFLLGPGKLDNLPTWRTIRDYDAHISERVELINQAFLPETTMVLTRGRNARVREFYLPEYAGSSFDYEPGEDTEILSSQLRNLVLFEDKVMSELEADSGYQTLSLPTTGEIRYFSWSDNQQVTLTKDAVSFNSSE